MWQDLSGTGLAAEIALANRDATKMASGRFPSQGNNRLRSTVRQKTPSSRIMHRPLFLAKARMRLPRPANGISADHQNLRAQLNDYTYNELEPIIAKVKEKIVEQKEAPDQFLGKTIKDFNEYGDCIKDFVKRSKIDPEKVLGSYLAPHSKGSAIKFALNTFLVQFTRVLEVYMK